MMSLSATSQAPLPSISAGELQHKLKQMQTLGSVLYLAAHPDDENTRLITYLDRGKGYRTAYLSLTRGDGGQNLIGDEKGEFLGVLRTQELLAARRLDGGEQFFSRAFDFGYSKTPEETLEIWDEDKVLADVVWTIRKYRPDVIITRFATPEKGGGGHGHHTSSAILAHRAFDLAADPNAYPEQLAYVKPWQPKRLLWNNYWVFRRYQPTEEELEGILTINAGTYDPLLGKSYGEIAYAARSMHRCQAFGSYLVRGDITEYLEHEKGERAEQDLFDGIDASWSRVKGGEIVGELLTKAYDAFKPTQPEAILPTLAKAYEAMEKLDDPWVELKQQDLANIMLYCAGIWMEFNSAYPEVAKGDSIPVDFSFIKRSDFPVQLLELHIPEIDWKDNLNQEMPAHGKPTIKAYTWPTAALEVSQPYWLNKPREKGIFNVDKQAIIGLPQNPSAFHAELKLQFGETVIRLKQPVIHKYVDRARGEIYRPFVIAPKFTVNLAEKVYVFADNQPQEVAIQVKSFGVDTQATVSFVLAEGWTSEPAEVTFHFEKPGDERSSVVKIFPPANASQIQLQAQIKANGETINRSYALVDYEHIPAQAVFMPATAKLVRVDLEKKGEKIGYIMGSGDEVPKSLLQMGYQVDLLQDEEISRENLQQYDAVVAGIRAYNRNKRMPYLQEEIFAYVKTGGTYLVQYNTTYDLSTRQPAPYPITLSRDRVTKEDSEVDFLAPDHPVLNTPNKLTKEDFMGWNQERGLYFPRSWDEQFTPILSWHDPGEESLNGGLLVATYGEGHFVYTGISFFRHLPAGVAGSYRLLANLVSLGKN